MTLQLDTRDPLRISPRAPRVSVIIPTRDEAENLPSVLAELPADYEVIVIDGHSHDGTPDVARALRPDATVITQTRCGKGNAMACGLACSTGDILVMLDADGSTDPQEIPRFVNALVEGADFAKGTRFANGGGSSDITWGRRMGNRALNGLVNTLYGTHYTDLCYGYNAFWRKCLPVLDLDAGDENSTEMVWGDGFEIETLMNVRVAKAGLRVVEVPSYELERIHGVSKLHPIGDGWRVLHTIATERRHGRARRHAGAAGGTAGSATPDVIDLTAPLLPAAIDVTDGAARAAAV